MKNAMVGAAEPFALNAQHKKAWRLRKERDLSAAGQEEQLGGGAEEKLAGGGVEQMAKQGEAVAEQMLQVVEKPKEVSKTLGEYQPEKYRNTRLAFIRERCALGTPWKLASKAFDLSDVKRKLLQNVSLTELKRRKFLGKEATENPWA